MEPNVRLRRNPDPKFDSFWAQIAQHLASAPSESVSAVITNFIAAPEHVSRPWSRQGADELYDWATRLSGVKFIVGGDRAIVEEVDK